MCLKEKTTVGQSFQTSTKNFVPLTSITISNMSITRFVSSIHTQHTSRVNIVEGVISLYEHHMVSSLGIEKIIYKCSQLLSTLNNDNFNQGVFVFSDD
jgi:hypothetical protein